MSTLSLILTLVGVCLCFEWGRWAQRQRAEGESNRYRYLAYIEGVEAAKRFHNGEISEEQLLNPKKIVHLPHYGGRERPENLSDRVF